MEQSEFDKLFKTEEDCKNYLKEKREEHGITCPDCGSVKHNWVANGNKWICANCGHVTRLTSNTIMHHSHLPLLYWFKSIKYISDNPNISAHKIQILLNHKRYQPIWEMVRKLKATLVTKEFAGEYPDDIFSCLMMGDDIEFKDLDQGDIFKTEPIKTENVKKDPKFSDILETGLSGQSEIKHKTY